jgi:hypothetical protein
LTPKGTLRRGFTAATAAVMAARLYGLAVRR